ncbi:MAG: hypothetical protein JWQ71_1149 [Pedosphaera sp.]|nr:hypothetical protein [Pedosphaera sp.]
MLGKRTSKSLKSNALYGWVFHPILPKNAPCILPTLTVRQSTTYMKYKKSFALTTCLVSMALVTGCPSGGKSNNNGISPASLQGHTLHVAISSGNSPFSPTGSYVFIPSGNGNSGSYQLQGSGGAQSNIGTYTYSKNGPNTGFLVETEESGTMVQNVLTFTTVVSGTIHSSSSNKGGSQDGSFTLN